MKFNNLSHDEKLEIQKLVLQTIEKIGSRNYFLGMIEDIKESKQHPLLNKTGKCHFTNGTITWGKAIYKDKVVSLKNMIISHDDDNILTIQNPKLNKDIKNALKAMGKLEFVVHIKGEEKFTFKPFNTISEKNVELDPLFQIIFFDGLNNTKKILIYK
jgi:ribosomal protein L15